MSLNGNYAFCSTVSIFKINWTKVRRRGIIPAFSSFRQRRLASLSAKGAVEFWQRKSSSLAAASRDFPQRRLPEKANSEARIHLICGEKRLPYYRPRICEIFSGLDPEKLLVRNHQWFIDMDIEVVNGMVASIDADKRQIKFTDSSYLFY